MKKITKLLSLLLIPLCVLSLFSCKKDKTEDPTVDWDPYPYDDLGVYLTLADYRNLSVSQSFIDKEIALFLDGIFSENDLYESVTDGSAVKELDRVKIVFSSIVIDGTTVYPKEENASDNTEENAESTEGDSSESEEETENSSTFTVGAEQMVSEIENAVIGMTLNSEKEVTFTVPDEYKSLDSYKDYVGKTVTFKFKLTEHSEPPEVTDDLVYRYTSMKYSTVDIMREVIKPEIIYEEIWDRIVEGSVLISCPEKEYHEYYDPVIEEVDKYAKSNNKTREQYITEGGQNSYFSTYEGITVEEFYRRLDEYAKENVKGDLILYSIVRAEGCTTSGPLYERAERELMLSYGIGYTIDEIKAAYGEARVITDIMSIQVRNKVLEYVTVTD